jgi:hypothetical protein
MALEGIIDLEVATVAATSLIQRFIVHLLQLHTQGVSLTGNRHTSWRSGAGACLEGRRGTVETGERRRDGEWRARARRLQPSVEHRWDDGSGPKMWSPLTKYPVETSRTGTSPSNSERRTFTARQIERG